MTENSVKRSFVSVFPFSFSFSCFLSLSLLWGSSRFFFLGTGWKGISFIRLCYVSRLSARWAKSCVDTVIRILFLEMDHIERQQSCAFFTYIYIFGEIKNGGYEKKHQLRSSGALGLLKLQIPYWSQFKEWFKLDSSGSSIFLGVALYF